MIPTNYRYRVASGPRDILLAQSIRWTVFSRECGYIGSAATRSGREESPWDLQSNALHLLVEDDHGCVGAARLIIGHLQGGCHDLGYGLPIESEFYLESLAPMAECVAEIGRVCIVADHRGRGAAQLLYHALARESVQRGVTRWVGSANTNFKSDAAAVRLEQRITELGLWADTRFVPRTPHSAPAYDEVPEPDLPGLPLVLRSYVAWGAIRFAGRPVFNRRFSRYAIPFVGDPMWALSKCAPDKAHR